MTDKIFLKIKQLFCTLFLKIKQLFCTHSWVSRYNPNTDTKVTVCKKCLLEIEKRSE